MSKIDFGVCRDTLQTINQGLEDPESFVSMAWDGKLLRVTAGARRSGAMPYTMILDGSEDYSEDPAKLAGEFIVRAKQHFSPAGD